MMDYLYTRNYTQERDPWGLHPEPDQVNPEPYSCEDLLSFLFPAYQEEKEASTSGEKEA